MTYNVFGGTLNLALSICLMNVPKGRAPEGEGRVS